MLRMTLPTRPHVLVFGNLKGGSGKSTLSMHVALGLMKEGRRVATIDLDFQQRTLTRYIDNRKAFAKEKDLVLDIPTHFSLEEETPGAKPLPTENERINFVSRALAAADSDYDFIIIDTPSGANKVNVFAHGLADTVVTPINDSFLDLDVIATLKDPSSEVIPSPYTDMVRSALRARGAVTSRKSSWYVVRNRMSALDSRNERAVRDSIERAASGAGFLTATGLSERVIYRELFPRGLTALDSLEASLLGVKPSLSHVLARLEVRRLIWTVTLRPSETGDTLDVFSNSSVPAIEAPRPTAHAKLG
jgi:chromosome partitioning protein